MGPPLGWGPSFSAETGDPRAAWSLGLLAWVSRPGRTRFAEERHADTLSALSSIPDANQAARGSTCQLLGI